MNGLDPVPTGPFMAETFKSAVTELQYSGKSMSLPKATDETMFLVILEPFLKYFSLVI